MSAIIAAVSIGLSGGVASALHGLGVPECSLPMAEDGSANASIASDELTNKQTNWYRIRVFGDDRHRDDLYTKDIRRTYWFYAKVEIARSNVSLAPLADRTRRMAKLAVAEALATTDHECVVGLEK